MEIYTIKNSPIEENSFIIADPDSNLCMVIDPFDEASITSCLESRSLKLQYILLTHEHIDHIRAVNGLRDRYKCKLVCSQKCSNNICDSRKNLSDFFKLLLEINGTIEIPENFEAQFAGYRSLLKTTIHFFGRGTILIVFGLRGIQTQVSVF